MSASNVEQQIREASKSRFEKCTTEDLLEFCGYLKVTVGDTDTQEKIRQRLLSHLDLNDAGGAAVRSKKTAASSRGSIRPPVNLSINGLWGGRRYLIKVMAPSGTKIGKAEPIGWNGKATYWLPYNETVSVPEPIYNILLDRRTRIPVQKKINHPDGMTTITTDWEFNAMPFIDMGVDPKTASLPGSITEFYQDKKPSWFKALNTRELQTICGLLEVSIKNKNGAFEAPKSDEEMLSDIFVTLFGYADVEDADNTKAA